LLSDGNIDPEEGTKLNIKGIKGGVTIKMKNQDRGKKDGKGPRSIRRP